MQDKITADLKTALLAGDKSTAETLRGLKSAILYEAVAVGKKDEGLSDDEILKVLAREQKKRTESIELYLNAGETERANKEKAEQSLIANYLPEMMSESDTQKVVDEVISKFDNPTIKDMGQIMGQVKIITGTSADGALIASLVKAKLGA